MSFWRGASHTYRVRGRLALLARLYRHKDTSHLNITLKASIYIRPIEQILKVIYTETLFDWSRLQIMNKIAYEMSRPRVRGCTVVWAGWGRCAGGFIAGKYLASIPLDTSPPLIRPICPCVDTSNFICAFDLCSSRYVERFCSHTLTLNRGNCRRKWRTTNSNFGYLLWFK